jgi:hypothetical protein
MTDEQILIIAGTLPIEPWGIGSRHCDAIAFARAIADAAREEAIRECADILVGLGPKQGTIGRRLALLDGVGAIRALLKEGS